MFAALSLGLFDMLDMRPRSAEDVALEIGAVPEALERLLEACAGLGLLTKHGGLFRNSELASVYLARRSPQSLAGYASYSNDVLYPAWQHLEDAVLEGTNRWRQTFDFEAGTLFEHFFRTPEAMETFLLGMHGFGTLSSPAVVRAFDLSRFRRMIDLGGATGHLAAAACERYPKLHGVVFDYPRVIDFTRTLLLRSPHRNRLDAVAGDFFIDPLPPGDLYCLGRILHDWAPPAIERLLARVFDALPFGGALLIAEKLLDDDRLGPVPVQMQSLNMLVITEGRERSLPEYRELLVRAGFTKVEGIFTGQPLDAVLATK